MHTDTAASQRLDITGINNDSHNSLLPVNVTDLCLELDHNLLIDRVNLQLHAQNITMVMGFNGAGKSLLLRLLHGLITPTSGRITWNGVRQSVAIRRRQAIVFQRPVMLRRSVAANMEFVLGLRGLKGSALVERRDLLLEQVSLTDHMNQPARLLSGGEQQRLALARALSLEPDVLFLDEPTASLDPASVSLIENSVAAAHFSGTKIIFVTHDIGQAKRLAGDVIFMHRGKIVEQTSANIFFEQPTSEVAAAYLDGRIFL